MEKFTGFIPQYDDFGIYEDIQDLIVNFITDLNTTKPYLVIEEIIDLTIENFSGKYNIMGDYHFIRKIAIATKK